MEVIDYNYKGQLIRKYGAFDFTLMLYNEDGDVIQKNTHSFSDAKKEIDKWIEEHNGYYDNEGNLISEG